MPDVTIYTTSWCPYCRAATDLLRKKGVSFEEIDVERTAGARSEMVAKAGRTSVPQIFIGERHVGGCDDLYALDGAGKLDALLTAPAEGSGS
jgi:glutaredoxin 3